VVTHESIRHWKFGVEFCQTAAPPCGHLAPG
jgi:hypothetical protein